MTDENEGILEAAAIEAEADERSAPKSRRRPAGRPIDTVPTHALLAELERREQARHRLEAQRDGLQRQLADVERQLADLGPPPPPGLYTPPQAAEQPKSRRPTGPRGPRAKNHVSLPDAIALAVEVGATVTPKEAAELVRANGYRTNSKTFGMMVSNALAKDERFNRVGRGQYERRK